MVAGSFQGVGVDNKPSGYVPTGEPTGGYEPNGWSIVYSLTTTVATPAAFVVKTAAVTAVTSNWLDDAWDRALETLDAHPRHPPLPTEPQRRSRSAPPRLPVRQASRIMRVQHRAA